VTAVELADGERISADLVVGNGNYQHLESLLDEPKKRQYSDEYWEERTLAPSALLLYLGVEGKLPEIKHHTLLFGENWIRHFEEIFDRPQWPQQPSLYINKPTATDSSLAPKGHENLMVLVPIAANLAETELFREQYVEYILKYIEQQLDVELREKIRYQKVFSGKDFKQRYHSLGGSALGLAHTMRQTDIWRPRNYSKKLRNLYFVGADTVPGIGVPMTLISAELVRKRISVGRG
jgi:phytoene desaturase